MKVVVVGAGEVGFNIASTLSADGHDVNVVEPDEERAARVESELDVRLIRGNGARPQVLYEAGVRDGCDVDFLVACADRDEVNILSCWIAKRSGVKHVVARARGLEFTDSPSWARDLGIDMMFSPERSVAREIMELLSVSTATRTAELLDGQAAIYAFRIAHGSPLIDVSLMDMRARDPDLIAIVVYIERGGASSPGGSDNSKSLFSIVPDGSTVLKEGDLCYVVSHREQAWKLEKLFQLRATRALKKVFIVGGGKLGFQVASLLEDHYRKAEIRLIDHDKEKCEKIAEELPRVLVLPADGADINLLKEEGVDSADGYVCATESDEVNLIYCAIAKSMGARKCIAVVRRRMYLNMPERIPIDSVVDPNEALASVILRYIRYPAHSRALSIIEKIDAEMLEVVMPEGHRLLGIPLMEMDIPKGVLLALVSRNEHKGGGKGKEEARVFVPGGRTCLEAGDHVILFASTDRMPDAAVFFDGSENLPSQDKGADVPQLGEYAGGWE
ncbi:MAG: Trk system potassium transporter TrkA [Synergistaceae bacterium]|jgi:trk system potassium uptake protein TrkA|nr:Trk system potassium transporter TrkA [Synergistaceae bacterium]